MPYLVTPADRASFHRCRRQWDLGSTMRRRLDPTQRPVTPDLDRAIRDALAVYYFPGMWDWNRAIVVPLVHKAFDQSMSRDRPAERTGGAGDAWARAAEAGRVLIDRYVERAPSVDRLSPVRVETDLQVNIPVVGDPHREMVGPDGGPVRYSAHIDLLTVDEHDRYWVVRHRVAGGDWPDTESLVADQEALTAAWAWEAAYVGMQISGTVFNEFRLPAEGPADDAPPEPEHAWRFGRGRRFHDRGIRQHEPSGGGRSIPQHRRLYVRAESEGEASQRIEQRAFGSWFRRTQIRRSRSEIERAGADLAREAARMVDARVEVEPNPSPDHCPACVFLEPCARMFAGEDATPLLEAGYRVRPEEPLAEEGRLGAATWGMGRGAAPPRFGEPRPG